MEENTRRAIAELARVLGVAPDAIATRPADWLALMREGVIVRLHIRRWRAKARLELADLGLPAEADALGEGLLELGEKRLLPVDLIKQLDSIESAGRKALERAGYETYWGILVPAMNFAAWRELNRSYADRYLALGRQIVAEYQAIRANLLAEYAAAGRLAYRRLVRLAPDQMSPAERQDEDCFVQAFVGRIERLLPSAEYIAASFAWEVEYSYIPLPSLLAADAAEAERIRAARQLEEERERLARENLWSAASIEDAALRARQAALARMNEEIVAEARRRKEALIGGFLRDIVGQLRGMVYEAATDVLASLERHGGTLHPKSAEQIRNLFSRVASLNFYGDAEVEAIMAALRQTFDGGCDTATLRARLADVATVMRSSLSELGNEPRSAAQLGIPDIVPDVELGAARRRLALPELDAAPADLPVPARRAGALLEV